MRTIPGTLFYLEERVALGNSRRHGMDRSNKKGGRQLNSAQIYALGLLHGCLLLGFVWLVWPKNLTIRLSAHMIDGVAPLPLARRLGVQVSTVVTSGKTCPSAEQGNKCLTCRACWDKNKEVVAYGKH